MLANYMLAFYFQNPSQDTLIRLTKIDSSGHPLCYILYYKYILDIVQNLEIS